MKMRREGAANALLQSRYENWIDGRNKALWHERVPVSLLLAPRVRRSLTDRIQALNVREQPLGEH